MCVEIGHLNIQRIQNKTDQIDLMLNSTENDIQLLGFIDSKLSASVPLHIDAYYKSSESDTKNFEEFKRSVAMLSTVKAPTWVLGDFNFTKSCWADNIPTISPDCKCTHQYKEFVDLLNELHS